MKRSVAALAFTVILSPGIGASLAQATDLRNVLTDYSLTSWGSMDGLPSSAIWSIAQDPDGYLWLGTDSGLIRFDGVRFIAWEAFGAKPLPKRPVRVLHVSRDGSLWIGFGEQGGVYRHNPHEDLQTYVDGDLSGAVAALVEDQTGTVWAATTDGLYLLRGNTWVQWTGPDLPQGPIHSAHVDHRGHLFVSTSRGIFERASDEPFHEVTVTPSAGLRIQQSSLGVVGDVVRSISVDASNRLWLTDPAVGFKGVHQRSIVAQPAEKGRGARLLHDRAGNLWVGTWGQGLWRVKIDQRTDRLLVEQSTALTGLLGNGVNSLLEDRDGNVWAGTLDGLNRLSPHKATPIATLGLVGGVEITDAGVWAATPEELIRFTHGSVEPTRQFGKVIRSSISAMHADEQGTLWLATNTELFQIVHDRARRVPLEGEGALHDIDLITSDRRGGLWLYDLNRGLVHWRAGRVESFTLPPDLCSARITWMDTQRTGRLWLALANGTLAVMDEQGTIQRYGEAEGLEPDVYRAIYEDREGVIWLGGAGSLSRFSGGRFVTLDHVNEYPLKALTAISEDHKGYLWLGTLSGIVRISPQEFEKAAAGTSQRVRAKLYAKSDGLAGNPRWYGNRGVVRAPDGTLWFVTSRGVTIIDPRAVEENHEPAPVRIDTVVADEQRLDSGSGSTLGPGTRTLEIVYGALTLRSSSMTYFRYRLEGFDTDWIEAGTRRQVSYTNLPPGKYRFRVMAGSHEAGWGEPGTAWDFSIQPMFYQTWWFLVTCVAALGLVVGAAWRLHLLQVRKHFALLLGERARLSREIHDTLLQGLFGVALRCDAIANGVESAAPEVKEHFTRIRKDVEEYIREARQSIWNLRSPKLQHHGLSAALRDVGAHATAATGVGFTFTTTGEPHPCAPEVEEQLLRIGQEAVLNAIRHAHPSEVHMNLQYDDSSVVLRIRDDGRGFDAQHVQGANGHYGLTTMRERAQAVGGGLIIDSGVGRGTEVSTAVPVGGALVSEQRPEGHRSSSHRSRRRRLANRFGERALPLRR